MGKIVNSTFVTRISDHPIVAARRQLRRPGTVAGMSNPSSAAVASPPRPSVLHRWPSALGLTSAAVGLATGADAALVATTVGVAALCYLAAAALGRPWVGWAAIPVAGLVIVGSRLIGLEWWIGAGIVGACLVVVGLVGRVPLPPLTAQTVAFLGFGGLVVAALFLAPRIGLVLAGVALIGHGTMDVVILYRRIRVVPRSLAEFCMLLDLPLGLGAIVVALAG